MKINKVRKYLVLGFVFQLSLFYFMDFRLSAYQQKQISKEDVEKEINIRRSLFHPSDESQELELINSFPADDLVEKDIYLWDPTRMVMNEDFQIFISDAKWRRIFSFDKRGKLLRTIGRKGQGPGELMNPYCIYATKKHLLVSDTTNNNIQFFNYEGHFEKSIKMFKAYLEIASYGEDGLIYAAPLIVTKETPLIDVLTEDGRLLRSIVKPRFQCDRFFNIANMIRIDVNRRGEIIVAFIYFPIVQIYSQNGELLKEIRINNESMKMKETKNLYWVSGDRRASGWRPVIYSIKASEKGFYVLHQFPPAQILEYDEGGNQINDYWIAKSNFGVSDFIVKDTPEVVGNQKEIYILQNNPESKVFMFRPKK